MHCDVILKVPLTLYGSNNCRDSHIRCGFRPRDLAVADTDVLGYAGDRLTPKCTNCRKAKPPKECILDRLEIRESNYAVKVRTGDGTRNASTSRRPLAKGSVDLPAQHPWMTDDIDSLALSGGTLEQTDSALSSIPTLREHQPNNSPLAADSSPESLILATSTSFFSRGDAPSQSSYLEPVSTYNAVTSPLSLAVTSSRRKSETASRRNVTNFTEQYAFEFYINYAGPWVGRDSIQILRDEIF